MEKLNSTERIPLGVKPKMIWLEDRIFILSRKIYEFIGYGNFKKALEWTREMEELMWLREFYLSGAEEKEGNFSASPL